MRKDSDSIRIQAVTRTHTETHVVFAMSREGPFCTSNYQTCSETKSCSISPACFTRSAPLQVAAWPWASSAHSSAMETGFVPEQNSDSTFHPSNPVTLPQAASPVLFALDTLSSAERSPVFTEPLRQVHGPAAPCKIHTDQLNW